ncbi:psbP domain-containing protein 1, chloroplastic isoform X2 [Punica granatum]|uniref:PsbP domain-containing protein 1, chloroplastic isoform X2 n=1 Tax=Punica granatum TaxID=22663 RepID=A0A6P8C566_PUNGR|nr:psbP domain-containing protein 1, chloroplastic isoform X2 [Punica granatum]
MAALHVCGSLILKSSLFSSTTGSASSLSICSDNPIFPVYSLMARILDPLPRPAQLPAASTRRTAPAPPPCRVISASSTPFHALCCHGETTVTKAFAVPRRKAIALILSGCVFSELLASRYLASAQPSVVFREYIDTFDGYSFKYPQNWIQVRGAGADIFFRDPYVLDENLSVEMSSPSSSNYKSVEDLGPPEEAGKKVLRQYLTEFMSTRLGVRRESNIISTSSRVADDGRKYYQVEVNIKSYANNNELAVMPEDRVVRLEWDRRYLSVLGVENNQLYELRLQTPESVFVDEENDLRQVMDSFRVNKVSV